MKQEPITITTTIKAPLEKVWQDWNSPDAITKWAFASDDWEAPTAENDLRTGGTFKTVMRAKDKSSSFDFTGTYTAVKEYGLIEYDMDDGRHVKTEFETTPEGVLVTQTFDPENKNPLGMQRQGWQSILNNFKKYTENH
jgi:uncharacterized protein YndB with AHSA1/START domain